MAQIGIDVPPEPPLDYDTHAVLNTFYLASKGRQVVGGMSITPLELNVRNITDVLDAHPCILPRQLLDSCVFALDALYLKEEYERLSKAMESST